MSSCQKLAQRYVKETGKSIPAETADYITKSNWLYVQQWGCILPGDATKTFHKNDQFDLNGFCYQTNNNSPPAAPASSLKQRPPVLNSLQETGFLAWANQRGLQCINRIVGNFYGLNTDTGLVNAPGPSITPPQNQCWGACQNVTTNSTMCFQCINQVLLANPSLCPINPNNPDDENLIADSISCHNCVGLQGSFVQMANKTPGTPDDNAIINNMWVCITSGLSAPLSATVIVLIAIFAVMIITTAVILGVYFGYIVPRNKNRQQERDELLQRGISPDEL